MILSSFGYYLKATASETPEYELSLFASDQPNVIIANLLSIAKVGIPEGKLTSAANLSQSTVKPFLNFLVSQGLLERKAPFRSQEKEKRATFLYTTEKGFRFLSHYRYLTNLVSCRD